MLTTLFQASINQGTIPPEWKEAKVVPIFKKGDKSRASNYRLVSLTVVTCKMLEHIICSSIHKHLEKHRILTDAQHGFRKKQSCESQLILTVQDLAKSMDPSEQIDLILLDFSKAFDKVPHERLLYKAQYYGIDGSTLLWIRDFLSSRNQRVLIEGQSLQTSPVCSGVPQGSVIGPLMFLLFINDHPDYVKSCNVRLFADDSYCIGESIGHQTCNRFRTRWIIYFSGNKTGKWNSIPASVSFYVSPTNVSHLPEITIYMDTN
jgi:hypothetical protein